MVKYKPTLCLDFDGVLHSYTSRWNGVDCIPDEPVKGAFEFIKEAYKYFHIVIYSSRSSSKEGIKAMEDWVTKHDHMMHRFITFSTVKPPAFLTIDDRAMLFTGEFPNPKELLKFKPWNKK